ncbi:MAG: ferredoxin reductase [bacterium]
MGRLSWRLGEVVGSIAETPTVRSLVLSVPDWERHRAGQHVDVRLTAEDGYQAQRSYSIGSAPEEPTLMLTIERLPDGEVSPYLVDELRAGDKLELRGPIGGYFTWHVDDGGPLLLVAGGSGVVPLMAMIRHRAAARAPVPMRLLFSSRTFEDVIYREELDRLAKGDGSLEVVHTLTRQQPDGWTGFRRRIDQSLLQAVAWPAGAGPLAFICGPTRMVESVATLLATLGYDPARIKTERFGPTGGPS